jgi:3-dehydroquinate dehydratase type I
MKLVVTIFEETPQRAIDAIRALDADHDAIELRVDAFRGQAVDWKAVRAATSRTIIATNRGGGHVDVDATLASGIELVDVEWGSDIPDVPRERIVLSHHDYDGMPDVESLVRAMRAAGCAHAKLAVTPHDFAENARLLALLDATPDLTVIGMGGHGLYTRILAPFFGSAMQFVSVDEAHSAAPGQLDLDRALAIYGPHRDALRADAIFAIVGNPVGHSGSPAIHNAIFRERGVAAAYAIFETGNFLDIAEPFARGERFAPKGLSVTAPFKEEALAFARRIGGEIAPNALDAGAVNTLVRIGGRVVADNTDVDGFSALISNVNARGAAVIGAGGTARAALVALRRAGIAATVFNRTAGKLGAESLDALSSWRGDLIINTLPGNVAIALPPAATIIETAYGIEAAYGGESRATFNGFDLLRVQAVRQNALFLEACK